MVPSTHAHVRARAGSQDGRLRFEEEERKKGLAWVYYEEDINQVHFTKREKKPIPMWPLNTCEEGSQQKNTGNVLAGPP